MNSVNLVGRIGNDLVLQKTKDGKSVLKINLAVRRKADKTDWFSCTAWNATADTISQHFKKGELIGLTGQLYTEEYEPEGGKKQTFTKIFINEFTFIESKKQESNTGILRSENAKQAYAPKKEESKPSSYFDKAEKEPLMDIDSDDLPF